MIKKIHLTLLLVLTVVFGFSNLKAQKKDNPAKIKNVVLVHGAFVDGSGWKGVYDILTKRGYDVTIAQIPLTSLKDDNAAVRRILDKLDGQAVLVGHSWGGTVITEASSHKNVGSLVYVTAFQPDKGESTDTWYSSQPGFPEAGILPPDNEGFAYYDVEKFHAGFAADLSHDQATFMAHSQKPILASSFITAVTAADWHTKPTFGIVPTSDKSINPIILRNMYKRSGTKVTEIKGASHAVFISHPQEVANVIIEASK
ncbi:alpha/beta hydrolase [Chryseobacterium sp. Mn2064]|uniref:alpha/beta hydrolase n=1 Tax=Chryseobacterium sp. Mn2064 TaxID=3395263 RepID=UPI003BC01D52